MQNNDTKYTNELLNNINNKLEELIETLEPLQKTGYTILTPKEYMIQKIKHIIKLMDYTMHLMNLVNNITKT